MALDLADACDQPSQALGLDADELDRLRPLLIRSIEHAADRPAVKPTQRQQDSAAGTRLCSPSQWRRPDWAALAKAQFGPDICNIANQSRWVWERISLLETLMREIPAPGGFALTGRPPRVLLVAEGPDLMAPIIAHHGYEVRYGAMRDVLAGCATQDPAWTELIQTSAISLPRRHAAFDPDCEADRSFDAVIMMRPVWFETGPAKTDRLIGALDRFMKRGALLAAVSQVNLGERMMADALTLQEWRSVFTPQGPLGSRGFTVRSGFDADIPLDVVVRHAPGDQAGLTPGLSYSHGDEHNLNTVALFCASWPERLGPTTHKRLWLIDPEYRDLYARLGRSSPMWREDRATLAAVARSVVDGAPAPGWTRLLPELRALALSDTPHPLFGLTAAEGQEVMAQVRSAEAEAIARTAIAPEPVGPRETVQTRLCSGMDWEGYDWQTAALAVFGSDVLGSPQRKPWIWERVSLLLSLFQRFPDRTAAPRVLVAGAGPEPLAHILAHFGFDVTAATTDEVLHGPGGAADWSAILASAWLAPLHPVQLLAARGEDYRFDAVVAPQQALVERDHEAAQALFDVLAPRVSKAASLHATFAVSLNREHVPGALDLEQWLHLYDEQGPLGARGFTPIGEIDTRIPLDTALKFAPEQSEAVTPGFSWGYMSSFITLGLTTGLWPARR